MILCNIDQYSHSIYKHRLNLWELYIDIFCFLIFRGSTQIDETLWRLYMNIMCFSRFLERTYVRMLQPS